jgi:peptidoglycan/LPS O-acetylase OafA/YrhL
VVLLTAHLNVGRNSLSTALFAAVANLFLFQSLIPIRKVFFAFNSVAWSISTEMFFYFAFPWLITKSFWSWKAKLALLAVIVVLYLWFAAAWDIPFDSMELKSASVEGLIYINPMVRVFEFFAGILAYWGFINLRPRIDYSASVFTILEIAVIALTVLIMYYSLHLPIELPKVIAFYIHKSGSFWMFALLIIVFAFAKGYLTRLLSYSPMILLGEISFVLYLVHKTVLEWYQINAVYFEQFPAWCVLLAYWLLALSVAYLLHKVIEKPCRKLFIALPNWQFSEVKKTLFAGQQCVYVLLMVLLVTTMLNLHWLIKLEPCPPLLCQSLNQQHQLSPPARFGDYVELTAFNVSADKLNLLFSVQQPLPKGYGIMIDVMNTDGISLGKTDTLILKARDLKQGQQWLENITIPADWLRNAQKLAISLHSKAVVPLKVSYPETDMDGDRMLIKIYNAITSVVNTAKPAP